jgi:NodT family efflux transporter outer membrane factor (OMF) lipoprotein
MLRFEESLSCDSGGEISAESFAKTKLAPRCLVGGLSGWGMDRMLLFQRAPRQRGRSNGRIVRLARTAGVFGLLIVASGCLEIDKPELGLDIPESYRAAHGASEAATPALDWWRGFKSRELTSFIEQATVANFDIAVAIAQIAQADAQVRIAGAPLLPTFDYNASDTAAKASQLGERASGTSPFSRLYATSLSASYIIDFWGKNRATLNAAIETSVASRYNREVVTLTALTSVADTYFQILAAQDRLRIARRSLADSSRILFLIKQQFEAGTASDLNVAQQESLVETVRATIPPLEETLRQNIAALAVLVGKPPERFNARGGSMMAITVPRVTPGLPSELINRRPDVRQAEQQLKSVNYGVESARAAFFPTIQLTGQLGYQSNALRMLFGPGAWFYTAAASLTQPLFDGGVLLGQFELQKGQQAQFLQAYRKSVLSAFSNVEQALIAVEQTTKQERIQENVVRASRRAFMLSEQQMNSGTVNMVTLLQVEQTLFTAEDQLAVVQLARLLAVVGLFQALGGGWPPTMPANAG